MNGGSDSGATSEKNKRISIANGFKGHVKIILSQIGFALAPWTPGPLEPSNPFLRSIR